jgi:type II secretion system protein G
MLIAIFNRLMKLAPAVQLSSFCRATPVCEPPTGRPCRSYVVFLFLACLGAALSGCSGPPSATDGRQAIEDRINRDSGGRIRLVQFQKTNGQLAEVMGVKVYTLEYETEIEFLEACKWNIIRFAGAIMDDEVNFRTTKSPDKPLNELAQLAESTTNPGTEVAKGQRFKLVGAIRFEKKEKGWWVDGVKVASITPADQSSASPGQVRQQSPQEPANPRPPNERLKVDATKTQIATFKTALDAYKVDTDYYPKGKNGLNDLIQKPRDAQKWYGPYLAVDKLPKDPWGHDYIYECPGHQNPDSYDLMSMGPDGRVGGGDDISNWPQQTSQAGSGNSSAPQTGRTLEHQTSGPSNKVVPTAKATSITVVSGSASSPTRTTATSREAADLVAKFNLQMDDLNTWIEEEGRKIRDESTAFAFGEAMLNKAKNLDAQRLPEDFKAAWADFLSSSSESLTAAKATGAARADLKEKGITAFREYMALAKKYDIHKIAVDEPQQKP